ncbi:C1 family peptidase [Plebeiibacterium marinum]|uniref:Aminopeptidase n=1 Tax=Plebeiibacterium marinum TaxID=2992111 RepID=A0AAE3MB54_9BACT|nr:C1 family peptidase [Plebeiobacterium marinum]MCW3804344.1 aminopeptidase [Plebeiobacterium marinum]
MKLSRIVFLVWACFFVFNSYAQEKFVFEPLVDVKTSPVKSQDRTGTCWAYSTVSFIESEIMRMGGQEFDLSEMYMVKHAYQNKARQYVFLHGLGNFSQGGQAHDVMNVVGDFGFVQEEDYPGFADSGQVHNHTEMEMTLKGMIDNYVEQKTASPSDVWFRNINSVLTNYLGEDPKETKFNKRIYTPVQFAEGLGIDKDNYIELTSYTHHPFYKAFDLEVPDNWSHDRYYNLPLDELIDVMKKALEDGYSFVWDGDVSDQYFSRHEGVAILPKDRNSALLPQDEMMVTPDTRQKAFYSWQTTDDHLMHIVGMAKDQNGTVYFKTKNSWGTNSKYQGYWYMSEAYVRMNTVAIMLHKQALGKDINKKLFGKVAANNQ